MRRSLRPSPAMLVACVALFVALTGTSVAVVNALPKSSVGTAQLKNNAVVSSKVKDGSLKAVDFAAGQLPAGQKGDTGDTGPAGAAGPAGPAGPSNAYARWANGPIHLGGTILSLAIPQAGKYVLWAKAFVGNTEGMSDYVTCRLTAGGDYDQTTTRIPSNPSFPASNVFSLSMLVTHDFGSSGTAVVTCSGPHSYASYVKVVAIRVESLTNTAA